MTVSIYRPGADSADQSGISSPRLPHQHSLAADFESEFFDTAKPVGTASPSQVTVENIARMFCVSSLYREAFNNQEWGK